MKRLCLSDIQPSVGSSATSQSSSSIHVQSNDASFKEIQRAVRACQRCIVITGAGISVSSGIPDFRSPQGLFQQLKQKYPSSVSSGRDLFDATLFHDPGMVELFYSFMGELRNLVSQATCTPTHAFIKELDECGKLLRCYTQNIDSLEKRVGLETGFTRPSDQHLSKCKDHALSSGSDTNSTSVEASGQNTNSLPDAKRKRSASPREEPDKLTRQQRRRKQTTLDKTFTRAVQLHGDLDNVVCTICHTRYPFTEKLAEEFCSGAPPPCPRCKEIEVIRDIVGKRSVASGVLRPDIVLYNETHPQGELIGKLSEYDLKSRPDLLIVIGTSLKIPGIKRMIREMSRCVHSCTARAKRAGAGKAIFINKDEPPKGWDDVFDYYIAGDADDAVRLLPIKDTGALLEHGVVVEDCLKSQTLGALVANEESSAESSDFVEEPATKKRRSVNRSAMSLSSILNKTMPKTRTGTRTSLRISPKPKTNNKLTAMMRVVKNPASVATGSKSAKRRAGSANAVPVPSPYSPSHMSQDKSPPEAPRSPLVSSSC
ncbi:NAD-dependent deacetylase hst3 [Coemansia sp. RSA 1813]|nr:NAD-dependent deacetylase hst3 [Coemansia sp. RSA 1646]KAJ1767473.1 NAD-dependent deacetylase hst3 [Coemansia sp. RSA 1843]KAJ2087172.1 NAD-dependent deacetylase hst3 [Coemansia sp. RSA 986]KAJ2211987.1 NAD-dependent deacetylase hst3 [Coemansia sp. RSA 487]KAJ2565967.1 NAD-dependent deacetylase hst3 [Coemansia sp. RSA 1813]